MACKNSVVRDFVFSLLAHFVSCSHVTQRGVVVILTLAKIHCSQQIFLQLFHLFGSCIHKTGQDVVLDGLC